MLNSFIKLAFSYLHHQVHVVKVALIYNPKSGAKKGEKLAMQAMKLFHNHGVDVEMFPSQRKGHVKDICKVLIALLFILKLN